MRIVICESRIVCARVDFVVSRVTLNIETNLGYKIFLMFGTVNIGAMGLFSLYVFFVFRSPFSTAFHCHRLILIAACCLFTTRNSLLTNHHSLVFDRLIPETKGRSLEEMDVIFGAVSAETRAADIRRQEEGEL